MPEIQLGGCRPEPLMSYLRALGVFRIIAKQGDRWAKAAWVNDRFILRSRYDEQELIAFLLDEYIPTPILAPWAGGSGFFGKDNKKALARIEKSKTLRLAPYRDIIARVEGILEDEGLTEKPSEREKEALLRRYRRELPDIYLEWMDCVVALQADGQSFPPILGTGGNDGRQNFTQNFMQRLLDVGICPQDGSAAARRRRQSEKWLRSALFGEPTSGMLSASVGQFHPGRIGGPNATQGMEGDSFVNPWEFIMAIEGVVMMSGAVAMRLGSQGGTKAAFPFTVLPTCVGQFSLSQSDERTTRSETWLPLWHHFVGLRELKSVFSEGRAELKGRQCRDGVEFARAVASLGTDRGFSGFIRYAFVKRSGKAYLAAPLGRLNVTARPDTELLSELERDGWLENFRRACRADKPAPPPRFPTVLRRLDSTIFDYCRYGGESRFAAVIAALGRIERELAFLPSQRVAGRLLQPVPILSAQWLPAANDGSVEFRIAAAIASIFGTSKTNTGADHPQEVIGPLRSNLESVVLRGSRYIWTEPTGSSVWVSGNLTRNLVTILARRMMEARRENLGAVPLDAGFSVSSSDIAMFLEALTNNQRIEDLLWGLILIGSRTAWQSLIGTSVETERNPIPLPRPYALLKLLFLPRQQALRSIADKSQLRAEPAIVDLLRAGSLAGAINIATRRLRSAGFIAMPGPLSTRRRYGFSDTTKINPLRLCAALLIPVRDIVELKGMVLRKEEPTGA